MSKHEHDLAIEPTDKERAYFDNLLVPVNPDYDFDGDPTAQFEYANPVTLSNKLILYTNAAILLNRDLVSLARRRERTRLEKNEVDRQMKALRRQVLSKHAPPPSATKNLVLTDAHVNRALETEGLLSGYKAMEDKAADLEDKVLLMKEEESNLRFTMETLKLAAQNITSSLSWTKTEAKMGSRSHGPN